MILFELVLELLINDRDLIEAQSLKIKLVHLHGLLGFELVDAFAGRDVIVGGAAEGLQWQVAVLLDQGFQVDRLSRSIDVRCPAIALTVLASCAPTYGF